MKVKEALNRLAFTIQKQNKPNQVDADAFNKLLWFVNESIETNPNKNICFAKLYIYNLIHYVKYYQSIDIAQEKLHQVLDLDIESLYVDLMKELNNTELWDLIKSNQTDKQILKRGFETFDIDTTKQNTNAMITLALKSFSKQ
jgi:hypothetical protein